MRVRRRIRLRFLMLIVFVAGIVFRISEYKSWFALKYYRVEAQSQALEQRLWSVFPMRCLTFWPYLLKDARGMGEFLERDMPVTVETHMESFGRFKTVINWLKAWVKVQWRGKIWCISRDGKMWLSEQGRPNEDSAGKLVWKIPEQGSLQDEVTVTTPEFGVFDSPLDTEVIAGFVDEFRDFKWFDSAIDITWERRAGMDLFIVKLSHGGQNFELYLQREKYPGQDVGAILDELFSRLITEGGSHIIDATYEGKILLRNL